MPAEYMCTSVGFASDTVEFAYGEVGAEYIRTAAGAAQAAADSAHISQLERSYFQGSHRQIPGYQCFAEKYIAPDS